jgi:FtsP/CotA-like multicopper oxidase with cupredoxin domain
MTARPISRRRALQLAALGAASVGVGAVGWATTVAGGFRPGQAGQPLVEPEVLASRDGVLQVQLTADAGSRLAGRDTSALGFNGASPGPTLQVRPGDVLRVRLVNRLDQPTNLHTHGLHVTPQGRGDNPFVAIAPGASRDYELPIPSAHPAGTFWYHPHHHGYAADQLFGGLAGALLVGGDDDLAVDRDRVLVVADTTLDAFGRVVGVGAMDRITGREGRLVLVNRQLRPTITAPSGTLERWRIINACPSRVLSLRLDGHRLAQVALDGHTLPRARSLDRVVLAPGNRADVLVRSTNRGDHRLIADPYDRGSIGMGMGPMSSAGGPLTLATLRVDGPAAQPRELPSELPAPATRQPREVTTHRELTLATGTGMGMGMGGMTFTINGRRFDPGRVDQTAPLGTTEEWTVRNSSPMVHPFHLHVWPFEVVEDSTGTPPAGVPQDVVLVPAHGWVRLRVDFVDHAGRSVYHCHVLDHEDAGMMGTIEVQTA